MYRDDDDLEFLGKVKSEDLNDLVHLLIYDKDGIERLTEELSYRDSYKRYSPDHHQYWEDIAGELQCYGANTLVTIFRGGKGVLYKEILCDVCNEMKVNFNKNSSTERIEDCLFMKILEKSFENMSQDEINKLARDLGFTNISSVTPQMLLAACQAAFGAGGFCILSACSDYCQCGVESAFRCRAFFRDQCHYNSCSVCSDRSYWMGHNCHLDCCRHRGTCYKSYGSRCYSNRPAETQI